MKRSVSILALSWVACCGADAGDIVAPQFLPAELVAQWLARDPSVLSARSELLAAQTEATQLEASPYEWTSRMTYQERDYDRGASSHEWNVGLERQVRLPGKRNADESMATATRTLAEARFSMARRLAARDLLDLWLDWSGARAVTQMLKQQQQLAHDNLQVVTKRVQHGDAALLEQRLAAAEVNDIQGSVSTALTTEGIAWAKLSARFGVEEPADWAPLPEPVMPAHDASWWQARILAASARLSAAQSEQARAEAAVSRAQAERLPDPTLGVYAASEARGDEDIIGGIISIPFPGERRSLEVQRQLAHANATRDRRLAVEIEVQGIAGAAFAAAVGKYTRWQLASAAVAIHRDNAAIAQKAYVLGEQDLQTLLLARRQALRAAEAERQARADALRAYGSLLIDADLLWQNAVSNAAPQ